MVNSPLPQQAALSELLKFRCNHCFQALQVPISYAGQSAPCPFCREITVAPRAPSRVAVAESAAIRFSCPSCRQGLTVPARLAEVTGPCCFCGANISAPSGTNDHPAPQPPRHHPPIRTPANRENRHGQNARPAPPPPKPNQFHSEQIKSHKDSHRTISSPSKRRSPLGVLAIGASVFGIAATTVFFAGPGQNLFRNAGGAMAPSDQILERARANRDRLADRKDQAINEATSCIRRFLTASDWSEACDYAVGVPQAALGKKMPLAAAPETPDLTFHAAERLPGTESFRVKHWLDRGPGHSPAAIWVEETEAGPRVRWDFLEQQLSGRLRRFQTSKSAPPTRFYAKLQAVNDDQNPLADIPGLAGATVVAVSSAFSNAESEPFYAISLPDSPSHRELTKLFTTSDAAEGWISASRSQIQDRINCIVIKDLQLDRPEFDTKKPETKRHISLNYGNSGIR